MKQQSHKQETVRVTIDFPADQYTYIKILAVREGINLEEFIIEHLPSPDKSEKKDKDIEKDEFDELLKEVLVEKASVLKRLAKK